MAGPPVSAVTVSPDYWLLLLGIIGGLLASLIYDFIRAGRNYVNKETCRGNRETCPAVTKLSEDFTAHRVLISEKVEQLGKEISESHIQFTKCAEAIAEIRTNLAVLVNSIEKRIL